jgi:hypothetical protein
MIYTFIYQACSDFPVAACCRVMKVSTSGFYSWRRDPVSDKEMADALLTKSMFKQLLQHLSETESIDAIKDFMVIGSNGPETSIDRACP